MRRAASCLLAAAQPILGPRGSSAAPRSGARQWLRDAGRAAARQLCSSAPATAEALREFRENVAQFAASVVAPHAEHIDRANSFPMGVDLWREMGAFGLLGGYV